MGHKQITQVLQQAFINKKIAHAYLFSGAEGLGKYKTAWAFARMLQCTCAKQEEGRRCLACDLVDGQTHPDIRTITPQSTTIRIEQMREIQQDVQYGPRVGNRKIFILDGVERLTEQAANSLLKLLEEPPDYVVFILLTLNMHSVLTTMLSRCQHISFQVVPENELVTYLIQRGFNAEQAATAAAVSGGIPGRALLWADSGYRLRELVIDRLEDLQKAPRGMIWDVVSALDEEREQLLLIFELISFVLRDCLAWKATGNRELLLYKDCAGRIAALAENAQQDELLAVFKELGMARQMLIGNANSRLLVERLCLKIQDGLTAKGEIV